MLDISTRLRYLSFLLFCGLLWQSCNVINPAEQVPTYIHIDSFHFKGNPVWPSLPVSAQITNISVYYNNNPIGNYDLPATIPVMATGKGTIEVSAGINVDGMNNLTGAYPFYRIDTSFSFVAQPGKVLSFTPTTSFYSTIKPTLISDFTGPTLFGLQSGNISMLEANPPDSILMSGGAGSITLNAVGDSSVDSTIKSFTIPAGTAAYIEFNYRGTLNFFVGMQSNLSNVISTTPFFLAGISPSGYWQKFYLDVTDFVGQYPGDTYTFYVKAVLVGNQTSGRLLIDNIYLITF